MEDETADGWTLQMAVRSLLPETHQQILAAALVAAEIKRDAAGMNHYRPIVWSYLLARVVSGQVIASGFEAGKTARHRVDLDFVRHAHPDFSGNSLQLNGALIGGLRFRAAEPKQTPPAVLLLDMPPALAWMTSNVPGAAPRWKLEAAVKRCMVDAKVSYREARRAWSDLPAEVRGKRGAHK